MLLSPYVNADTPKGSVYVILVPSVQDGRLERAVERCCYYVFVFFEVGHPFPIPQPPIDLAQWFQKEAAASRHVSA